MKTFNMRMLAAVLCLVLLCGCGANNGGTNNTGNQNIHPSGNDTQQEDTSGSSAPDESSDEQNTPPEVQEEPAAILTDDELAEWESYFNTMENNGLLRFPYADLENDPDQLAPYLVWLFYDNGVPEYEFSDEELALLAETDLWLELDSFRLSREFMNSYLYKHFNIPAAKTENLLDAAMLGVYLLEYDAWYISHGDTEYNPYEFNRGEVYEDGSIKLYYYNSSLETGEDLRVSAHMVVTLIPRADGTWYIAAHEINEKN